MACDWWRSWHGAPTDPKWLSVAKRAGVPAGMVAAVAWALFDFASQADERGDISGFDPESVADFFGWSVEQVSSVIEAMASKGMVVGDRLVAWNKRQPKREDDTAAERKKQQRQRDNEHVTQCHAASRNVTLDTDTDTDKKIIERDFEEFYQAYPRKKAKGSALKAYKGALRRTTHSEILAGVERLRREKREKTFTPYPASWLNADGWADEPEERATSPTNITAGPWKPFKPTAPEPDKPPQEIREEQVKRYLKAKALP